MFKTPLLVCLMVAACFRLQAQDGKEPASLADLRAAIQAELDQVGYGSVGVALVSKEKTIWADGIGVADPETRRATDRDTYWRVGSISKSVVGLAVLILEERGKLRLTDTVASLAPEIEVRNRWEDENPLRLAHLLEHTAGLDDLHFKDYASNDPTPLFGVTWNGTGLCGIFRFLVGYLAVLERSELKGYRVRT